CRQNSFRRVNFVAVQQQGAAAETGSDGGQGTAILAGHRIGLPLGSLCPEILAHRRLRDARHNLAEQCEEHCATSRRRRRARGEATISLVQGRNRVTVAPSHIASLAKSVLRVAEPSIVRDADSLSDGLLTSFERFHWRATEIKSGGSYC